jgi:hypothetical protein
VRNFRWTADSGKYKRWSGGEGVTVLSIPASAWRESSCPQAKTG